MIVDPTQLRCQRDRLKNRPGIVQAALNSGALLNFEYFTESRRNYYLAFAADACANRLHVLHFNVGKMVPRSKIPVLLHLTLRTQLTQLERTFQRILGIDSQVV
jgi:hypothetical protein